MDTGLSNRHLLTSLARKLRDQLAGILSRIKGRRKRGGAYLSMGMFNLKTHSSTLCYLSCRIFNASQWGAYYCVCALDNSGWATLLTTQIGDRDAGAVQFGNALFEAEGLQLPAVRAEGVRLQAACPGGEIIAMDTGMSSGWSALNAS